MPVLAFQRQSCGVREVTKAKQVMAGCQLGDTRAISQLRIMCLLERKCNPHH